MQPMSMSMPTPPPSEAPEPSAAFPPGDAPVPGSRVPPDGPVAQTGPEFDPDAHPETVVEPDAPPEPETGPEPAVDAEPAPVDEPRTDSEEVLGPAPRDEPEPDDAWAVTAHGDAGDLFDTAEAFDDDEQPEVEIDDDEPEVDAGGAPLRPGDLPETPIAIWSEERAQAYHDQWHDVKALFVDEPEAAVAQAQFLVTDAVHALAETLLAAQTDLDPRRQSLSPDTETLRVAMRRYREFLDRVLAL
ncbi:hypothetical protein SAMN05444365_105253 [Micromonospora pattaloongensis]|uniref:Uncharacterized protein n=1 Tax=Micromonospora pattaloongensis TaxID=405436 RepID=A0A1H3Q7T1_9ACTN|nr:hypothetical protein [Micromonospora pattaloongensis]SDZ08759.1 hypothetical protein SAMN05444365_105253 [Micromonospora pattaloongensis]